jgi:ribosome-interacting GTPase 1
VADGLEIEYAYSPSNSIIDETDTIDLPEYLSKALVYYVKAKMDEDRGEIEQKEYNMREFRRILEKHESSKIRGPRVMVPGSHGIR